MSDRNQGLYPKETIANLLNLSERRLEQLAKQKIIPKAGRGVFDLGSTVTAYVRYLQGLTTGAIRASETSELDKRLIEAKVLERESKARQAKCRADAMEQDLADRNLCNKIRAIPGKVILDVQKFSKEDVSFQDFMDSLQCVIDEILNGDDAR